MLPENEGVNLASAETNPSAQRESSQTALLQAAAGGRPARPTVHRFGNLSLVVSRTLRCDDGFMTSREFTTRARECSQDGTILPLRPDSRQGGHGRVHVGARFTTVQRGELKKGVLAAMLRQLNIARREF